MSNLPTKAVALKPCPFCGGTNIAGPDVKLEDSYGNTVAWIECEGCGAQFEFCVGNVEAGIRLCSQAWNRRFASEPAEFDALENFAQWCLGASPEAEGMVQHIIDNARAALAHDAEIKQRLGLTKNPVRTDCYGSELAPIAESDGAIYSGSNGGAKS